MQTTKTTKTKTFTKPTTATIHEVGQIITLLDGTTIEVVAKTYIHPNKFRYTYKEIR